MASIVRPALFRQAASAASRAPAASIRAAPSLMFKSPGSTAWNGLNANSARVTSFHTTSKRSLLPPPPQTIQGGVNDPVPVPAASPSHGSYHWTFERLIAAGLVPLTFAPLAGGSLNPTLDALLCGIILVHSHLGFQVMIVDYIPKRRMPGVHKIFMWALNGATALVALGLYEFETTDVGITEAISRIWHA